MDAALRTAALAVLVSASAPYASARTVVSLGFDDGTPTHLTARDILDQRGLKATFYINSGRVGDTPAYLTLEQVRSIAASGHEIGGHTIDHLDLTTLSASELRRQVCDDRAALIAWGFLAPVTLAYPFGASNSAVQAMVRDCGYAQARTVGGLSCSGCPRAESIPPGNAYDVMTPDSIKNTTTLAAMKKMVTDAEQAGGGWVPIVLHLVCDNCGTYAISPANLAAFADWLKAREASGTVVLPMGQALGAPAPDPAPSVAALAPSSAPAGGAAFTLTVDGSGFAGGAVVLWNGSVRTTAFLGSGRLRAAILAGDLAAEGAASVTVRNPDGKVSAARSFVVYSTAPPPPPGAGFADSFTQPDGLITNQNAASPRSTKWVVSNGSLFASGGRAWTGVPDGVTPDAGSTNGTGSAYFRALSAPSDISSEVRARVTVQSFVSVRSIGNWDGAHFFLRYRDSGNYYQVSIRRRDGRAAIKKRRNGTESTFTTTLYTLPPLGTPQNARAIAVNNATGTVTIQLFMEGRLVASATDASNPHTAPGKAGMGGENTQFYFDDFSADGSSVPAGPPPAPAPVASTLSPSSAPAGTAGLTLTVAGSGFVSSSTVRWNGSVRATVFVSGGLLQAQMPPSDLLAPATASVTVFTPAPGGGTSAALSFLVVSTAPAPPPPPPSSASTVVSLTFDDGSADQLNALRLLDERGLKGTFYINSALIGQSGFYLTLSQLRSIAASGHEIGGHSKTHPYLTGLSQSQLQDEVCGDRAQLQAWGFSPTSFAYPYAADNAAVRDMARSCGYESGRDVGGIGSAESIPPANAYLIRTHASVEQTDSLSVLQQRVTAAEDAGGGWVPIVMHRVCSGCGQYSMTEATLAGFLDWLVARRSRGTAVMTVHEVMSGGAPPPAAPSIFSLSPASALAGGPAFSLTVDGAGFAGGASVLWNGAARPTTFVSAARVQAAIPASDIAAAGGASVAVSVPGEGTTASAAFTIASTGTPPPSGALFAESFDRPDGLITNEYAYYNPADPAAAVSPDWQVTAGSLFAAAGAGWTGVPDTREPDAASSGGTGSAVFRARTKRADFGDVSVSFTLVNRGFVSASPAQAYDAVRLALRYLSESSYYEFSFNRRDNTVAVKKRSGSTLTSLGSAPYAVPFNAPQSAQALARNNADGSVTLTLTLGGVQRLSVTDASSPLRAAGALMFRSENADFRVDGIVVQGLGAGTAALSALAAAPASASLLGVRTVVSLTFDDGSADQLAALRLLDQRGLKGTFYVNTGLIGTSGFYLTLDELRRIAGSGHEIGGHSLTHPDLRTLDAAALRREVCDDRARLRSWGLDPVSFAYPYGAENAAVRDVTRSCGYSSGRLVGRIPAAGESIRPPDAFAIRTHESVTSRDSLAVLQKRVTDSEEGGGGWVPIVMHRVCDGCGTYSMTEATLASFLDWLRLRAGSGTVVRTVAEVMAAGQAQAPPPAAPPAPAAGASLDSARLFPNPWRADLHAGQPVTIDHLPPGSTVRLYTASGRWLRTIDAPAGVGSWDLADDGGRTVASGLYLYLADDGGGGRRSGVLAVLR